MKKNILLTVIVTLLVVIGVSEVNKSLAREQAANDLNEVWPSLKNDQEKVAALMTARTVHAQNKSWFSFLNSSASEEDEPPLLEDGDGGCLSRGSLNCYGGPQPNVETEWGWELPGSNVESSWAWQDPVSGEWHIGESGR